MMPRTRPAPQKAVRIVKEQTESNASLGIGTRVIMPDGQTVPGVTSICLRIKPCAPITAEIELNVSGLDISAMPILGLDTLLRSAAAHGLHLCDSSGGVLARGLESDGGAA